jgi:predicted XRE-type DNA-binding protein
LMKSKDEKEKFIELRASGLSFDKIASMLNISKPVLISWSVEFQKEIKNLEYFRYQAILEQYKLIQEKRIEFLSIQLNKVNDAISKKNFEDASLKELISIRKDLNIELLFETKDKNYLTGVMESSFDWNNEVEKSIKLF